MKKLFNHLVIAGTFDHLHNGHRKLIDVACEATEFIYCGLTVDSFAKKKPWPLTMQSFQQRFLSLRNFFCHQGLDNKYKVLPIKDTYGFSTINPGLQAIVATKNTLPGVLQVNERRKRLGFKTLSPVIIDLVKAGDQKRISSTRIRKGEINRHGLVFTQIFPNNKTLYLPKNQRIYFKKPVGKLISGSSNNSSWATIKIRKNFKNFPPVFVVTVGDIATQSFIQNNIPVNLAVVDFRHRRQNLTKNFHQKITKSCFVHKTPNSPGTISPQLILRLKEIFKKMAFCPPIQVLEIIGEEDLSVLPIILFSPLNTQIFYGQPDKGIVQVKVTEKTKEKAVELVKKFSY